MKKTIFWCSSILVFILLFIGTLIKKGLSKEEIKEKMVEETLTYKNTNLDLLNLFNKELESPTCNGFKRGQENIRLFITKVTSYKFLTYLSVAMAIDKIKHTSHAEDMLNPLLEEYIIAPCIQDAEEIIQLLENKLRLLQQNTNQHRAGLLELSENKMYLFNFLQSDHGLEQINTELLQKVRSLALNYALTVAECTIEAVMIKSTFGVFKRATIAVTGKLAATFSAGTFSALIDGPLPIGDIIAAILATGGLAWTGYDIYRVSQKLPRELENAMSEMICNFENDLKEKALNKLKEAIHDCEEDFDIFESKCITSLGN